MPTSDFPVDVRNGKLVVGQPVRPRSDIPPQTIRDLLQTASQLAFDLSEDLSKREVPEGTATYLHRYGTEASKLDGANIYLLQQYILSIRAGIIESEAEGMLFAAEATTVVRFYAIHRDIEDTIYAPVTPPPEPAIDPSNEHEAGIEIVEMAATLQGVPEIDAELAEEAKDLAEAAMPDSRTGARRFGPILALYRNIILASSRLYEGADELILEAYVKLDSGVSEETMKRFDAYAAKTGKNLNWLVTIIGLVKGLFT